MIPGKVFFNVLKNAQVNKPSFTCNIDKKIKRIKFSNVEWKDIAKRGGRDEREILHYHT